MGQSSRVLMLTPKLCLGKPSVRFVSEVSVTVKIDMDDRVSVAVEFLAQEVVEKSYLVFSPALVIV